MKEATRSSVVADTRMHTPTQTHAHICSFNKAAAQAHNDLLSLIKAYSFSISTALPCSLKPSELKKKKQARVYFYLLKLGKHLLFKNGAKKKRKKDRSQIVFSRKVSFDEGKINECWDSVTNTEGKDWGSLDLPVGKHSTKVEIRGNKKERDRADFIGNEAKNLLAYTGQAP